MPGVVRVGDAHAGICNHGIPDCCPHGTGGLYVVGSDNVVVNGQGVVRVGDVIAYLCIHGGPSVGVTVGGSGSVIVNGRGVHRVGDVVVYPCGGGAAVSGSGDVIVG